MSQQDMGVAVGSAADAARSARGSRRRAWGLAVLVATALVCALPAAAAEKVRVGWCTRSINPSAAPFAVAVKMGWFAREGIELDLVPLAGSTDCVKFVATRDVMFSLASIEPLSVIRTQGVKVRTYYTAYQHYIYGLAVPEDSPIRSYADLKGKTIGVTSMATAGVPVARALAKNAGLDPDKDIQLVVAGEAAQAAQMVRGRQVDALSQFDTQYAMIETAGVKLRRLANPPEIAGFPSNGFVALDETLVKSRKLAVAVARGYAMGTVFSIANPEAAVRMVWEVWPQTRPTGKDEATALRDDIKTLQARLENLKLEGSGVTRWGEGIEKNYGAYADFLVKWGIIKESAKGSDLMTNDLIADINAFDAARVTAEAKAYRAR